MICYTYKVNGGKALPCSPSDLKNIRSLSCVVDTSERLKEITEQMAWIDPQSAQYQELDKEKKKIKMSRPALIPHASAFSGMERKNQNAIPSGLVLFDLDHYQGDPKEFFEQKIKDNLEDWNVAEVELSASGDGLHILFMKPDGMTIQEAQKWMAKNLETDYDEGTFDLARCCFVVPEDYVLYQNDELLFGEHEIAESELNFYFEKSKVVSTTQMGGGEELSVDADSTALPSSIAAFDLCAKQAGLDPEKMDIWGEHNWHSNLMAVLSVGLAKLMSKEQLYAVVNQKLPNYSQTKDCKTLIDYFYQNYSADKGFMSVALREINAQAQQASLNPSAAEDDKEMEELTQDWNPPALPKKIPHLMNLLANNFDPRFREMLMLSALPILSAHASHFRATYLNGRVIGPQQYVAVIGGSGKGKGNCTELYKEMIQYTLQDHDDREWDKVRANTELRDQKANAKDRPPKYHPKIRLFETTSKSSILELQTNLGKNGMLLGQFSEVDGLSSATRSAFSDISVLLRKGWDMDMHRQFYMSDATCNTYCQMSISLLMAGTVKAMLERMFSDNNCEGGLMQRCIPVLVPQTKRTFRPPKQNYLTDEEKKERDALIIELYQKDLSLGDGTFLLETPMMNKAIGQWFDELEERYSDGLLSEAEADLSHRCGEFMLRAAIPLIALYGKETKEIVAFSRWVGEMAHYTMCHIFGHRVQKDINSSNELLAERLDARKTVEPLLAKMPDVFSAKEFSEQRIKEGQSSSVKMLLSRYCKNGKIERIGRGVYKKCKGNIVTVTKNTDPNCEEEKV